MARWRGVVVVLGVVGCTGGAAEKTRDAAHDTAEAGVVDTAEDDGQDSVPVDGTFLLLDAVNGRGVGGLDVTTAAGTATTSDEGGEAVVEVASGEAFQVSVSGGAYLTHHLQGTAGTEPFRYVTFLASPTITDQVYGMLGISRDPDAGVVVVGLDTPDLQPAVGAGAALDADYDTAFVFQGFSVAETTTIPDGGNSIVSFTNVPPGTHRVSVSPPAGQACVLAPVGTGTEVEVAVVAGDVSVVLFICS